MSGGMLQNAARMEARKALIFQAKPAVGLWTSHGILSPLCLPVPPHRRGTMLSLSRRRCQYRRRANFFVDIFARRCYYNRAFKKHARVVELADSLDSGSSVHYARAGSSPASRTTTKRLTAFEQCCKSLSFSHSVARYSVVDASTTSRVGYGVKRRRYLSSGLPSTSTVSPPCMMSLTP